MSTITTRRTLLPRLPAMLALLLAAVPLPAAAAGATSFTHPQLGFTIEKPAGWDTFRDRDEPRMTLQRLSRQGWVDAHRHLSARLGG